MDAMTESPRKLNAKIAYLCGREGVGPSELARIAGVTPASAAAYLKDSTPSTPSAVALARIADHFKVSMRWFLDDEEAIEQPQTDAQRLDDFDLMFEVARRFRLDLLRVLEAFEFAIEQDTLAIARKLFERDQVKWPDDVDKRFSIAASALELLDLDITKYNPDVMAWNRHSDLPGSERHPDDLISSAIVERIQKETDRNVGLMWIGRYQALSGVRQMAPHRRELHAGLAARYLEAVKEGRAPDPLDAPLLASASPGSGQEKVWRERAIQQREEMKRRGIDL